jgi:hypothetical protein
MATTTPTVADKVRRDRERIAALLDEIVQANDEYIKTKYAGILFTEMLDMAELIVPHVRFRKLIIDKLQEQSNRHVCYWHNLLEPMLHLANKMLEWRSHVDYVPSETEDADISNLQHIVASICCVELPSTVAEISVYQNGTCKGVLQLSQSLYVYIGQPHTTFHPANSHGESIDSSTFMPLVS